MRLFLTVGLICLSSQPVFAFDNDAVLTCLRETSIEQVHENCVKPTLNCSEADNGTQCLKAIEEQWVQLGMRYHRMAAPIERALNDLRVAQLCKEEDFCLGLSFLNMSLESFGGTIDISERKDRLSADCEEKFGDGGAEEVSQCSADTVSRFATINIKMVFEDLERLNEALEELSQ